MRADSLTAEVFHVTKCCFLVLESVHVGVASRRKHWFIVNDVCYHSTAKPTNLCKRLKYSTFFQWIVDS
ncbi:unnamed protein product [Heterobilharzia americana]|nr:unnamed protein product [Heterobilharzia americana]